MVGKFLEKLAALSKSWIFSWRPSVFVTSCVDVIVESWV